MKKSFFVLAILPFLALSCSSSFYFEKNSEQFATFVRYSVYEDQEDFIIKVLEEGMKYSFALDAYNEESPLYKLNHSEDFVDCGEILSSCLKRSVELESTFNGYFSIRLGNLKALYESYFDLGELPPQEEIDEKIIEANETSLVFDGNKVKRVGNAHIDLGGVGKGFFLTKAKEIVKEYNVNKYLLNLGASSILLGESTSSNGTFTIYPKGFENLKFTAKSASISTSSIFEQLHHIGNEDYSHIYNPFTGEAKPLHSLITIVGEDPCYLDAASTAFMYMDVASISSFNLDCIVIDNQEVVYSHVLL